MKTCRICGESLPLDSFHPRKGSPDGYRNDCRACNLANQRDYLIREREKERKRGKANYVANRDKIVQERRDFRAREGERINATRRARHAADPEKVRAQARARHARDPSKNRERARRRNFRRRDVNIAAIIARDGKVCGLCFKPVDPAIAEIDHILPRSKGGTNDLSNLQLAHKDCNRRKAARIIKQEPQLVIDCLA